MGLFGFGKTKDDNPVEIELSLFTRSSYELEFREDAIPNHAVAIDDQTRKNLKIKWHDYVEIKGKRKTVAMCVPIHSDHAGMGKILVSELCVINLGFVEFESYYNAKVTVRKIKPVEAEGIIFFPISANLGDLKPIIDERYLYDYLDGISLIKGDKIAFGEVSEGHSPLLEVIQVVSYDKNKDGNLSAKNFDSTNAVLISEKTSLYVAQDVTKTLEKYGKKYDDDDVSQYSEIPRLLYSYQHKKIQDLPDEIKSTFGKNMDDILHDVPHLSFLPKKSRGKKVFNSSDSSFFELRVVAGDGNGGFRDSEKITLNEKIWKKLPVNYMKNQRVSITFPKFEYTDNDRIFAFAIDYNGPVLDRLGVKTYEIGIPKLLRNLLGVEIGDYVFVKEGDFV